ncbi:MAG TPA: 2OG-Fe(II) oxygenase [Azospirillaceae bacterium]|nr:2OG-Fe(II) oxygenase [Azospirillaceae bacterium]
MNGAPEAKFSYRDLLPGDHAPWFHQRSFGNPNYAFDTAAGRYVVMCFFASAADPVARKALDAVLAHRHLFDDTRISFFGVSLDPGDESKGRVQDSYPGLRYFWDFDGTVSRLYGALPIEAASDAGPAPTRRFWLVLDPTLRVMAVFPFTPGGNETAALFRYLERLPPAHQFAGFEIQAPVLILPNVFEPEFCQHLIRLYDAHGGEKSGFMRDVDGKTVAIQDSNHKVRRDYIIQDQALIRQTQNRILRRVVPEIRKVHQFHVTRMERYIVSCYAADEGGHFRAHRDNTTKGTAHRRFAVSINLNSDFEGGEVSFPEYGPRSFKPPPGGAVVFSCSLLHAVSRVTSGRRYAFLPFLYDDAAARIREENNRFLDEDVSAYQGGAAGRRL